MTLEFSFEDFFRLFHRENVDYGGDNIHSLLRDEEGNLCIELTEDAFIHQPRVIHRTEITNLPVDLDTEVNTERLKQFLINFITEKKLSVKIQEVILNDISEIYHEGPGYTFCIVARDDKSNPFYLGSCQSERDYSFLRNLEYL